MNSTARGTTVWMLLHGCTAEPLHVAEAPLETSGDSRIVLSTIAGDYTVGALATIDPVTLALEDQRMPLSGDAVVRVQDGRVHVINRLGYDNVRRVDPPAWHAPAWEMSVGAGANPHDAVLCGSGLFVSLYGRTELAVLDPETGRRTGSVDLSAYADADGLPEASSLVTDGETLWVGLQRLDRNRNWTPEADGRLLAIDCDAMDVTEVHAVGPNPRVVRDVSKRDGMWIVAEDGVAWFDTSDGSLGEPRWTPTDALPHVDGFAADGERAVVLGRTPDARAEIWCDPGTGFAPLMTLDHYLPSVAMRPGGEAWIAARPSWVAPEHRGGVMVIDTSTCTERTQGMWLTPALPPFDVAVWP